MQSGTEGDESRRSPTTTCAIRQLAKREQPAMQAVVFLLLDVSGSMGERERQISKTFFFWAIQGLRRQYRHLDLVFVAHTSEAWEFQEEEFFRVTGTGGTVASTGLKKVREIIDARYSPGSTTSTCSTPPTARTFPPTSRRRRRALADLRRSCNYAGFLEVAPLAGAAPDSEIGTLFRQTGADDATTSAPTASARTEDIWDAVRHFFSEQAARVTTATE